MGAQGCDSTCFFAARLTPTTAVAGCFCVCFLFPCFLFLGLSSSRSPPTSWPSSSTCCTRRGFLPPRCFPVFSCWVLVSPVGWLVCVRCFVGDCVSGFWVFCSVSGSVGLRFGLVRLPPPPPCSPLVLLACAVRLASRSCMHSTRRHVARNGPGPFRPTTSRVRPHPPPGGRCRGDARGGAGRVTGAIVTPHNSRSMIVIAQLWRYPAPYETQPFRQRWVL